MSATPQPAPNKSARTKEVLIFVLLYAWSFALLFIAHLIKTTKDPGLGGEEIACGFNNAVYFAAREQRDGYAVDFSAHIFYWIGSYLMPFTIHSARLFKIIFVAAVPALLALLMKTVKPDARVFSRVFSALLFSLIPAMSWISIWGFEWILDLFFGLILLILCLRFEWGVPPGRRLAGLGGLALLAVWCVHIYPSSFIVVPVSLLILLARSWTAPRQGSVWLRVLTALVTIAAVILAAHWPYLYFKTPYLSFLRGGGQIAWDWESLRLNLQLNYEDFFTRAASYLITGWLPYPAFPWERGGAALIVLMLCGALWVRRNPALAWLIILAGCSLVITLAVGANPGIRRAFPLVAVMCVLAGLGIERLIATPRSPAWARIFLGLILLGAGVTALIAWGGTRPYAAVVAAVSLVIPWLLGRRIFVVYPAAARAAACLYLAVHASNLWVTYDFVAHNYENWLQREFTYYPGMNYEETMEEMVRRARREELYFTKEEYHYDTVVFLDLMCKRRGLQCIPPRLAPDFIMDTRLTSVRYVVGPPPEPAAAGR